MDYIYPTVNLTIKTVQGIQVRRLDLPTTSGGTVTSPTQTILLPEGSGITVYASDLVVQSDGLTYLSAGSPIFIRSTTANLTQNSLPPCVFTDVAVPIEGSGSGDEVD